MKKATTAIVSALVGGAVAAGISYFINKKKKAELIELHEADLEAYVEESKSQREYIKNLENDIDTLEDKNDLLSRSVEHLEEEVEGLLEELNTDSYEEDDDIVFDEESGEFIEDPVMAELREQYTPTDEDAKNNDAEEEETDEPEYSKENPYSIFQDNLHFPDRGVKNIPEKVIKAQQELAKQQKGDENGQMRFNPNTTEAWNSYLDSMFADFVHEPMDNITRANQIYDINAGIELAEERRQELIDLLYEGSKVVIGETIKDFNENGIPEEFKDRVYNQYDLDEIMGYRYEFFGKNTRFTQAEDGSEVTLGEYLAYFITNLTEDLEFGSRMAFLNQVAHGTGILRFMHEGNLVDGMVRLVHGLGDPMSLGIMRGDQTDARAYLPEATKAALMVYLDREAVYYSVGDDDEEKDERFGFMNSDWDVDDDDY